MIARLNKIISVITTLLVLFFNMSASLVYAQDASSSPTPSSTPEVQSSQNNNTQETEEEREEREDREEEERKEQEKRERKERRERQREERHAQRESGDGDETSDDDNSVHDVPSPTPSSQPEVQEGQNQVVENEVGGQDASEQVGDPSINTGDATGTGAILNDTNLNVALSNPSSSGDGSLNIINSGNGADSSNSGAVTITDDNTTNQTNTAVVENNLEVQSETGGNTADRNVGSTTIETGDANVTGTIVNNVNTNIEGVAVAEFNVEDVHTGDLLLDFAGNCISGCGVFDVSLENTGNGADSDNDLSLDSTTNNTTDQTNDATVFNNMTLEADSGNNSASRNTGGDSSIITGDANVAANVLTFANNNFSGNILYGVVNIFGDLIGDIILDEATLAALGACGSCQGDITAKNIGNGAGSENDILVDNTVNNEVFQFNDANIENNLIMEAETGDNQTSQNTGGNSSIKTGNASVDAQVLNIANSNIVGGVWWLVIVNEAGQWVGKILGAPDGTNFAGSSGTEFVVDENGEITAVNSGNGADSTNNIGVSQETNNTTNQSNTANIVNNIELSANTGGNTSTKNTGGNSSIKTGDAQIVANLVNFVNNNFAGGKVVVTVVNVFGSWLGDFVSPGQEKQAKEESQTQTLAQGGFANNSTSSEGSDNNNSSGEKESQGGGASLTSTPTPTPESSPTPGNNSQSQSNVLGGSGFSAGAVAGFKTTAGDQINSLVGGEKSKLRLNLAWGLFLLPAVLAFGLYKGRRLLVRKRLP